MSEAQAVSLPAPWSEIWPEWENEGEIGRGSYGVTYRAVRRESGVETRAAIKLITVSAAPAGEASFDAAPDEGDREAWLDARVDEIVGEIRLMIELKGAPGIVSAEDYKVIRTPGSAAIYIRMELLSSVYGFFQAAEVSENDVIRLGCDICDALSVCEERHIIHRDVKPENIMVTPYGGFKLGDFGISRRLDTMTHSLSQKGTSGYIAPEIMNGRGYDNRVDTYSLGLVLYQLLNGNRMPFTDPGKQLLTPSDRENAAFRRLSGEELPPPCHASEAMADVICRACAYDPADRFACAADLKKALVAVRDGVYLPLPPVKKGGARRVLRILVPALSAVLLIVLLFLLRSCGGCGGGGTEETSCTLPGVTSSARDETGTDPEPEPLPAASGTGEEMTAPDTAAPETDSEAPTGTDVPNELPTEPVTEPVTEHIHAYGEWVVVTQPTCTETGIEARICTCGEMEQDTLPALGHEPQPVPEVPASCTETGLSAGSVCAVCSETLTAQEELPALGHDFIDNICSRCGLMRTSEGLEYNGTVLIGPGTCTDTDIILPGTTTAVADGAFRGCTTPERIVIPDGVTTIGDGAFAGCTSLGEIVLPDSVVSIGSEAFDGCSSAVRLVVGNGVKTIGSYAFRSCTALERADLGAAVEAIDKFAFQGCSRLTSVTLPDSLDMVSRGCFWDCTALITVDFGCGVTEIDESAFNGCTGLVSLSFPDQMTYIAQSAFKACTSLRSVHFGKGMEEFDTYAFLYCDSLAEVTVDPANETFRSIGNCVLADDEVYFGIGTSVIPADGSVTRIGDFAFVGCTGLTEVHIPDTVTAIGRSAFRECTNLTGVFIPAGVTSIGRTAFYQCSSLTSAYIPAGVKSVAAEAFHLCRQLTITCEAPEQPAGWVSNWNSEKCPVEWGVSRDSRGLSFASNGDGTCTLTGRGTCTDARIFVPSVSPDGDTVTEVAHHALSYADGVTYVYLPDTVTSIGTGAFMGSGQLTEVRMPRMLTDMGVGLFQECAALERAVVPDGLTTLPVSTFEYCFALTDVTLPQSITVIDANAFNKCTSLRMVRLPDGLTYIGDLAFSWCDNLETVTLPASCAYVGLYAFRNDTCLTIRARMAEQPADFHPYWNKSACPVNWGWTGD